jgi:hypothetical protein
MSSASTDERRAAAQHARLERSRRIARLRRMVVAAALATFALAFGVIAFDGSMGAGAASSSGSSAPTTSAQTAQDDQPVSDDGFSTATSDGTSSASTAASGSGSSSDALTTSQS